MPMTLPLGSSSGPPLLPGLIAVSVWMRLVRRAVLDVDAPADGRDDPARDRVGELAERAADGDRLLADLDRRRVADRGGRQAGLVDLDDGEVGEGVDAVDRGVEGAAVLEVDGQLRRVAGDDVVVGEDEAVRVEDDARAGRRPGAGLAGGRIGLGDALGDDRDDGRADRLDDVDDRGLRRGPGRPGVVPAAALAWPAGGAGRRRGARPGPAGRGGSCDRGRKAGAAVAAGPPAAVTARYVPPEARTAVARTAVRTKAGPTVRPPDLPFAGTEAGAGAGAKGGAAAGSGVAIGGLQVTGWVTGASAAGA